MVFRHHIPLGLYPFVALTGTVLVSFSLYFNGERHGGPAGGDEMYFLWIVLWAAFHLRRRALALQVSRSSSPTASRCTPSIRAAAR